MSRTPLALVALALCLGFASASGPAQVARPAPPSQALDKRFDDLHKEFSDSLAKYQVASEEARSAKKKLALERPQKQFAPRYAALGREGHPRAARWCLDFIADTSDVESERCELFQTCAAKLMPHVLWNESQAGKGAGTPADYGVKDLVRALGTAGAQIGKQPALAICQELFDKAALPESKAQALNTQVTILTAGRGRDEPPLPEALELQRRLAKDFGETDTGKRAGGQLFRMEKLQVGMVAPEVETQDVEGVAFKLSDYRGKVVVLDFWGFW